MIPSMAREEHKLISLRTRLIMVSIPWLVWVVACFLPAYALGVMDVNETVTGWGCFVYGFGAVLGFDEWPWVLAWFGNITMIVATAAYLVSYKVRIQRLIAGVGAALSLLVLRFNMSDDGSGLHVAAFLWIAANFLLCYIIFRKNNQLAK